MKIADLINKGYFLRELPPPFNSLTLGKNYSKIKTTWDKFDNSTKKDFNETRFAVLSIPKVGLVRRQLGIPNPIHFIQLSEIICSNWKTIEKIFSQSKLTASQPIVNTKQGRALVTKLSYGEFKHRCIIDSFDKLYELKTDISKYYPSIYTHTIPWAIHTKKKAKASKKDLTLLGNQLDKFIQQGQSGQTIGVPIGPDTSLVISEILGCAFDAALVAKFPFIKGYRYVDDYRLYFSTQSEAEQVFRHLQGILTDYTLILNEEKTQLKKFPFEFESEWAMALNEFKFSDKLKAKANDLFDYVSLSFKFANLYPKDTVLKYAIKKLMGIPIEKENWVLFESLIFKISLIEPSVLPDTARILATYEKRVSKRKLAKVIKEILKTSLTKGHSFEVSWALWIAKTFGLKLKNDLAKQVFDSNDYFSILIALDMKASKLVSASTTHLVNDLEIDSFKDEKWLFAYEAIIKKWLKPKDSNILSKTKYFMTLKKAGVSFYDNSRQVELIKLGKGKKTPLKKSTITNNVFMPAAGDSYI